MKQIQSTNIHTTSQRGFNLVELMVVVAIIGVLAMFALPQYRQYVTKGRLQEAQSAMNQNYLYLNTLYNKNNGYMTGRNSSGDPILVTTSQLPQQSTGGDTSSTNAGYNLTVNSTCSANDNTTTATTFCLKAIPRGGQANAAGGGLECGTITMSQSGKTDKTATGTFKCW